MWIFNWIFSLFRKRQKAPKSGKIFFISDTHFDHAKIIKYSNRPFDNVSQMNMAIAEAWNREVRPEDTIYMLGDFVWVKQNIGRWMRKLNGHKVFIRGNHDKAMHHGIKSLVLEYEGEEFLLIHDPNDVCNWKGKWVIHGHTHNSNLNKYPMINNADKRINVSAELLNYKPIEFKKLLSLRDMENITQFC